MNPPDFQRAKQSALERLEQELPATLIYHCLAHTRDDVVPAVERLAAADVPVSVLLAPLIPAINDDEIESVLEAAANAGASEAAYIFLRLPHEVKDIFTEWLQTHFPDRSARVMGLVREAGGGRAYDSRFGLRQTGRGPYADLLGKRFRAACRRFALDTGGGQTRLDCSRFDPPGQQQLGLF